jgi:hypothetical protein
MLLSSEMKQNSIVLDAYRENPELMRRERAASLLNEAWLAARARTAQLAHPEIVAHLFSYYRFLGNARRLAEGWEGEDDPWVSPRIVFDQHEFARKDAEAAMDRYRPLPVGRPMEAVFAWMERREARRSP